MRLPVTRFPRAYQSLAEVNRAKKNGTFDIWRTMQLKNGQLFFLCYEEEEEKKESTHT